MAFIQKDRTVVEGIDSMQGGVLSGMACLRLET
jgi:hypothetical protein